MYHITCVCICVHMERTAPCLARRVIQCISIEHMYASAGASVYKITAYVFWLCRQRGANINFFLYMFRTVLRIGRTEF